MDGYGAYFNVPKPPKNIHDRLDSMLLETDNTLDRLERVSDDLL